jgi:hypothetical protein
MRVLVCTLALAGLLSPATMSSQDQPAPALTSGVALIARTTQAVDYRRGDHTYVDLIGTDRLPNVSVLGDSMLCAFNHESREGRSENQYSSD